MGQEIQKTFEIKSIPTIDEATSLMQPDLRLLYEQRAKRLRALAEGHAMKDYLCFAADLVDAQAKVLKTNPLTFEGQHNPLRVDWKILPLSKLTYSRNVYWLDAMNHLLSEFQASSDYCRDEIAKEVDRIQNLSNEEKEVLADQLLQGNFERVGSDTAIFLWAALSLYWAQLARAFELDLYEEAGVERHVCPICGSEPVASVVTVGPPEGARYLHCNLCESEWHYVRVQCSNCESGGKIRYWTLDDENSPIKTESCGDCHSHLKIFYQNKNAMLEPVADDLASLALDALMEEEGFARSTINPFLFPG